MYLPSVNVGIGPYPKGSFGLIVADVSKLNPLVNGVETMIIRAGPGTRGSRRVGGARRGRARVAGVSEEAIRAWAAIDPRGQVNGAPPDALTPRPPARSISARQPPPLPTSA